MSEAFERVIAFGFGDLELNRIGAMVNTENVVSPKLLERHGFVHEGLLREELCRDGQYYDY